MYANDPFGKVGYLQSAAFRASRLVVDTGMHAKRWTREQAIQSMVAATGDQESNIVTEIERYCVWPGQACGYMIGRQALNRMREGARSALGDRFDLKGFHDTVLTNGSTPLSVTESLVQQWVAVSSDRVTFEEGVRGDGEGGMAMRKWLMLSSAMVFSFVFVAEAAAFPLATRPSADQSFIQQTIGPTTWQCNRWCRLGPGWGVLARSCFMRAGRVISCGAWACYPECPAH